MNLEKIARIYHRAAHPSTPAEEAKIFARRLRETRRSWTFFTLNDELMKSNSYTLAECRLFQSRIKYIWSVLEEEELTAAATRDVRSSRIPNDANFRRAETTDSRMTKTDGQAGAGGARGHAIDPKPGPEHIWISEYAYVKAGRSISVRGHRRKRRVATPKADTSWKFDRSRCLGAGWAWCEGFTTRSGYSVRGHWRAARACWKKTPRE
jgi:hypothetical protein